MTPQPYFFTPSTSKLVLMSICTIGLYQVYWFYKNWKLIKLRTNQNIMPFWRAVFAPLWAYSCFEQIKLAAEAAKTSAPPPIAILAALYFLLNVSAQLPDPYWLITALSFTTLIPMNVAALEINEKIGGKDFLNSKFTVWNWVGLIVGGLLLILAIIGTFLPELPS